MYTDERFCIPCYNKGHFTDGDNFCSMCQNYMCLTCAQGHGVKCGKGSLHKKKDCDREQYQPWKKSSNTKFATRFDQQYAIGKVLSNTLENDISVEKPMVQITNSGHKSSTKLIYPEDSHGMVLPAVGRDQEETGTVIRTKIDVAEKRVRQSFSARGGAVRIARSSPHIGEEKLYRCCDHPDMVIENLCTNHSVLCCETCLNLKHKQCTIQPIDEVAHDILDSGIVEKYAQEFAIVKVNVNEIVRKYELCTKSRRRNRRLLEKERSVSDKGEQLETLKTKCNELDENVSISLAEIKNAKESENEVFTFITLKRNENILIHAKAKIAEMLDMCDILIPEEDMQPLQGTHDNDINGVDEKNKTSKNTIKENNLTASSVTSEVDNKIVIGDVVLHLYGTDNPMDHDDIGKTNEHTRHEDNERENQEHEKSEVHIKSHNYSVVSKDKNVDFTANSTSANAAGQLSKHRMKTYGLATEYYMKNDADELGEIRVLRLQSAPPERSPVLGTDSDRRSNSADKHKQQVVHGGHINLPMQNSGFEQYDRNAPVQTQNIGPAKKEMLTKSKKMIRAERVKQTRRNTSKTNRSIPSNDISLEAGTNYLSKDEPYKQNQQVNKKRVKSSNKKKTILTKTRPDESIIAAIISSHESREDDYRLKQWIIHTDEMSKMYTNSKSKVLIGSSENTNSEIDKDTSDSYNQQCSVSLATKEASVINVLDPDSRKSSAKSRTSETEEAHYNIQSYAHPPRSQLVLSQDRIVRIKDDDSICEINSIACLPDGRLLVSDFSNMQLKMLSIEHSKISSLKLFEPPHDVTVVSNSIAALITGLAYDAVLIIGVGQMLTIKRRFKTDCVCKAVDSYESHIYLLCLYRYRTEIHILSIDGVLSIRFILGNAIPSPKSISINALNGLIYIVDQSRGLYTVERCGKIVSRCFDKNIEQYIDVEADLNNNIFVTTKNPCGINELDYDGRHLLPILYGYKAEVVNAIAYNTANNSLVVGCANSEAIQIYKIHNSLCWNKN